MPGGSSAVRIGIGALAGIVLVSGLARVGVVDSRSTGAAAIRPVVTPKATPAQSAVPSPSMAATQVIPTPTASPEDPVVPAPSFTPQPFVTSPLAQTSVPADVETDLSNRLPVYDEVTVFSDPTSSKFENLTSFVDVLQASVRADDKKALIQEGFQGAYFDIAESVNGNRLFTLSLIRFATGAGSALHFAKVLALQGPTHQVSGFPGTREFAVRSADGKNLLDFYEFSAGRYYASVCVVSPVGDKGAKAQALTLLSVVHTSVH